MRALPSAHRSFLFHPAGLAESGEATVERRPRGFVVLAHRQAEPENAATAEHRRNHGHGQEAYSAFGSQPRAGLGPEDGRPGNKMRRAGTICRPL